MPDIYQLRKQLLVSISRRPRNETRIDLPWCTFVSRATGCSDSRSIFVSFFFLFFVFVFFLRSSSKGRPVSLSVMADNELSIRLAIYR